MEAQTRKARAPRNVVAPCPFRRPAAARPYALRAVHTQYLAQQSRPAYRQGWAEMIEYSSRMSGGGEMLEQAQARFVALQPAAN